MIPCTTFQNLGYFYLIFLIARLGARPASFALKCVSATMLCQAVGRFDVSRAAVVCGSYPRITKRSLCHEYQAAS